MKKIISIHTQHDANLTISENGEIVFVLELERIFKKRYFESSWNISEFEKQWRFAIQKVTEVTDIHKFDIAITNWVIPSQIAVLKQLINADKWEKCDHHLAHVALGYYDSNFNNPLILSYDGGGNDGVFNFYHLVNGTIILIERKLLNLGAAYRLLATLMPEITNNMEQPRGGHLSLSGKLMGYSALGKVFIEWIKPLENYFRFYQYPIQSLYSLSNELGFDFEENSKLDQQTARNLAASQQVALENIVLSEIGYKLENQNYEGIILTGGVALNVLLNSRIRENFNLPVHIPSSPNDCGISIGSIWALYPPKNKQYIAYKGFPLINNLSENVKRQGKSFELPDIAKLLINENAIIGVVRGNSEIGPRALGNRSIICYPDSIQKKDIVNNQIKFREWYRPLAPVVKEDKCEMFFGNQVKSPYMSFAYRFKEELIGKFPAVEHIDKTARPQTVLKEQNHWLYNLLDEIEKITGYGILMNTSFNTKGKPLLTESLEAYDIMNNTSLTHIIVGDLLFKK